MEKQYSIPWIDLINKKIDEIYEGESDINPYGGTNRAEFFSVASEYFFERPSGVIAFVLVIVGRSLRIVVGGGTKGMFEPVIPNSGLSLYFNLSEC